MLLSVLTAQCPHFDSECNVRDFRRVSVAVIQHVVDICSAVSDERGGVSENRE
jgi:hypothetical protein